MQDENKQGSDHPEIMPRPMPRKLLRDRQTRERLEFKQMQFERLRRQGADRFWRLR